MPELPEVEVIRRDLEKEVVGKKIKAIGMKARARIEELVGRKVFLGLFVRITPRWKSMPRQLAELGYSNAESFPHDEGDDT